MNMDEYTVLERKPSMTPSGWFGNGKEMIVEGVETEQQLAVVKKMGVNVIQGFYFFKPLTIEQVLNLSAQYQI